MIKKLVVLGLLLLIGSGCSANDTGASEESQKPAKEQTTEKQKVLEVKADNGEIFHYTLPKGWQKREVENSDFFVGSNEAGLDLIIEDKVDYVDFPSYQNSVINVYKSMDDQIIEQGKSVEIQGLPGVETVIEFSREGAKYKSLTYLLESEKNYVQIHTSTKQSRFDGNREELERAANALKKAEE